MLRLVDPNQPIRWIHPSDKDSDTPTIFHIIPLTEGQNRKLRAAHAPTIKGNTFSIDNKALMADMFESNVKLIENIPWPEGVGNAKTPADKKRYIECTPSEYMEDVYAAIQFTGDLDAGAVGNSEASHDSQT